MEDILMRTLRTNTGIQSNNRENPDLEVHLKEEERRYQYQQL